MFGKVKPENLGVYIKKVETLFPDFMYSKKIESDDIDSYYKQSYWGYAVFHSWRGAIHMALSKNGRFSKTDYLRQSEEVCDEIEHLERGKSFTVLEVGCGRGFNLRYLADTFVDVKFIGVDLNERNLNSAVKEHGHLPNLTFAQSDYHELLEIPDGSVNVIIAVETICHATNLEKALNAISRVLVQGGAFIVFDGFRGPMAESNPLTKKAVKYVERAMAVPAFKNAEEFTLAASRSGLVCVSAEDRSEEIMPNLIRLSDLAKGYFKSIFISRIMLKILPKGLVANSIAGLLMAVTVQTDAHKYMKIRFIKK